jgi:branched-chain amino acid aminotransferase
LTPSGSVFESLRSYNGKIFKLDEHLERLKESACTAGIRLKELEIAGLKNKIETAYRKSAIKNAYIRVAVSAGSKDINLIIRGIKNYPKQLYTDGVSIKTSAIRKPNAPDFFIKSSNYLPEICAKIGAGACLEAVLLNEQGFVSEATVSNIFIIKNKNILTAPVPCGLLNGITRQVIFDLARALRIIAREEILTRHDLYNADECFLTNTTMEIMPVVNIDGRRIGDGSPGSITKILIKKFGGMHGKD